MGSKGDVDRRHPVNQYVVSGRFSTRQVLQDLIIGFFLQGEWLAKFAGCWRKLH